MLVRMSHPQASSVFRVCCNSVYCTCRFHRFCQVLSRFDVTVVFIIIYVSHKPSVVCWTSSWQPKDDAYLAVVDAVMMACDRNMKPTLVTREHSWVVARSSVWQLHEHSSETLKFCCLMRLLQLSTLKARRFNENKLLDHFYRANICEGGLGSRNSVRLFVRLSVTRVHCDKTKCRTADIFIAHERAITLLLWYQEWLVGDAPFPLKSAFKVTHPLWKTPTSTDFCS